MTGLQYLRYKIHARSKFKVHSPFVYTFYTEVILNNDQQPVYEMIEKERSKLLVQRSLLETTDFGARASGSEYKTSFRQVKNITRHSSVPPKLGRLLHRLVAFSGAEEILEIGTAMGISTLYIASAAPSSRIMTMEGCAVIAEKARKNFDALGYKNIKLLMGNFDKLLAKGLKQFDTLDFVLIDGNHRKEPTLEYFKQILPKLHSESIMVIDDIHWSSGMEEAWKEIIKNEKVSISIDLFRAGILLFKKDIAKEDFVLRF